MLFGNPPYNLGLTDQILATCIDQLDVHNGNVYNINGAYDPARYGQTYDATNSVYNTTNIGQTLYDATNHGHTRFDESISRHSYRPVTLGASKVTHAIGASKQGHTNNSIMGLHCYDSTNQGRSYDATDHRQTFNVINYGNTLDATINGQARGPNQYRKAPTHSIFQIRTSVGAVPAPQGLKMRTASWDRTGHGMPLTAPAQAYTEGHVRQPPPYREPHVQCLTKINKPCNQHTFLVQNSTPRLNSTPLPASFAVTGHKSSIGGSIPMNQEIRNAKAFHTAPASGVVSVQNPSENRFNNKEGPNNECTRNRTDSPGLPKWFGQCEKPQSRVPLSVIHSNNTQQNDMQKGLELIGNSKSGLFPSSVSQCQNTRPYSAKENHLRQTNITVPSGSMTQSSHNLSIQSQSRLNCQFPSPEATRKDKLMATSSANNKGEQVLGTGQQRQTHVPTESQGMIKQARLQLYQATVKALKQEQLTFSNMPTNLYSHQNMHSDKVMSMNLWSKPNDNTGNHLKRIKMDNNGEAEPTVQETDTHRLAELQPKIYASAVINAPDRSDHHQLNKQNSLLNHEHYSITEQIPRHTSQSAIFENKHVIPQPKDKQSQSVESRQHYQCDICTKYTTNLIDLTKHISNHIGISDFYNCSVCFKRYPKKSNLKRHYENHSEDRPSCSICMKSFPGINSLARHNITHHGIKPTCSVCRKSFTRMSSLRRHEMKRSHQRTCTAPPERPHTCSVCMKSFSAISNLKHHEELHRLEEPCERAHSASSKDPHTCSICKKVLTGISNLKRHEKIHKRTVCWCTGQIPKDGMLTHTSTCENLPTCSLCGKKFRSEHILQKHVKNHENQSEDPSRLTCAFCSKTFSKVANTNRHQPLCKQNPVNIEKKTLEGRITVHCQECDKKFITQFPCQGPQSRAEQQLFRCDLCGISFEVLHDLIAHVTKHVVDSNKICNTCGLQTHLDKEQSNSIDDNSESNDQNNDQVTNFHCVVCNEEIETKRELKIHMQYHSERVFKCSMCPKSFYNDNRLQIHILHHTSYKQLKCLTCKMKFTQASSLERHKLIHSGRSKHTCDLCGAQFIQLYALKRHTLVHLQIKPHKCDYCSMRFRQIFMLTQHIKKFHAETANAEDSC